MMDQLIGGIKSVKNGIGIFFYASCKYNNLEVFVCFLQTFNSRFSNIDWGKLAFSWNLKKKIACFSLILAIIDRAVSQCLIKIKDNKLLFVGLSFQNYLFEFNLIFITLGSLFTGFHEKKRLNYMWNQLKIDFIWKPNLMSNTPHPAFCRLGGLAKVSQICGSVDAQGLKSSNRSNHTAQIFRVFFWGVRISSKREWILFPISSL